MRYDSEASTAPEEEEEAEDSTEIREEESPLVEKRETEGMTTWSGLSHNETTLFCG